MLHDVAVDGVEERPLAHDAAHGHARAGAGLEYAINPRTFMNVEYRYSNYGKARFEYADGSNTNNFDVDTDRHQVVAGVGMRF